MSQLPFHITTILDTEEFRLKEKSSLFLSQVFHVGSDDAATDIIKVIRKKYFDATHNCYAYKFADGKTKYSDDGEPNGTAGLRILNSINHEKLFNVLIIVTRYFGGVKLGVGPLGKTYYDSAYRVISKAKKVSQILYSKVTISFGYEFSNLVHRAIANYSVKIEETTFENPTKIICLVPAEKLDRFRNELSNASLAKVQITGFSSFEYH